MKIIILKYYFLPSFESFNRENKNSITLFENLSEKEWNE